MGLGIVDKSGMRFLVTKNLRPYDAGIMELGLVYTDKMAIPPKLESFSLAGYCLPECTAVVCRFFKFTILLDNIQENLIINKTQSSDENVDWVISSTNCV